MSTLRYRISACIVYSCMLNVNKLLLLLLNPKPWKLEVTPPRRKGNNFRGRGFRQNDSHRRDNSSTGQNSNIIGIEISVTEISQETIMGIENHLETEARIMAILVEAREVEAEVEADLIQVLMLEDRE